MKIFKQFLLFLICFLGVTIAVHAQPFVAIPDRNASVALPSEHEITSKNYLENLSDKDLTLVWKRVGNKLAKGWNSSVCDKSACWDHKTTTKSFVLPVGKVEKLDVHFYPNNLIGSGQVEILVWVDDDSINTVTTLFYKATAASPSRITSSFKNFEVSIYPNPVKDNLFVNGLPEKQNFKVELYTLLGNRVLSYSLQSQNTQLGVHQIDMQSLPKGVYMLRILDQNMNLVFNKSISKIK